MANRYGEGVRYSDELTIELPGILLLPKRSHDNTNNFLWHFFRYSFHPQSRCDYEA